MKPYGPLKSITQILLIAVDLGFVLRCFCFIHIPRNTKDAAVSVRLMKSPSSSQRQAQNTVSFGLLYTTWMRLLLLFF